MIIPSHRMSRRLGRGWSVCLRLLLYRKPPKESLYEVPLRWPHGEPHRYPSCPSQLRTMRMRGTEAPAPLSPGPPLDTPTGRTTPLRRMAVYLCTRMGRRIPTLTLPLKNAVMALRGRTALRPQLLVEGGDGHSLARPCAVYPCPPNLARAPTRRVRRAWM